MTIPPVTMPPAGLRKILWLPKHLGVFIFPSNNLLKFWLPASCWFIYSLLHLTGQLFVFHSVSLCVINGTGLSLQCWEDVLSSLRDFYLFNFGWSRVVNNASQPATCTVFIISMQPELSVEYLWVPAKCLWCYLFMLLLSIIHLFIYSWKN